MKFLEGGDDSKDMKKDDSKDMKEDDSKDMRWKENWMVFFSTLKEQEYTYHHHSIPIVPPDDQLRKSNNGNAYIPQVISIGPRHRGRKELLAAEGIKWRCIMSILRRVEWNKQLLEKCMEEVLKLDAAVRTSYGDEINLDRYELANVMLFDGCFLLELLLSISDTNDSSTRPCSKQEMECVLKDLMLVENQIPLVILDTLYLNLFDPQGDYWRTTNSKIKIQSSAMSLFGLSHAFPIDWYYKAYHFLDIAYMHIKHDWPKENEERQHVIDIINNNGGELGLIEQQQQHLSRCATRLEAVGITIKCLNNNNNNENTSSSVAPPNSSSIFEFFKHNVKLNKSSNRRRIILEIPQLDTTRTTEALVLWKNFIAWENHNKNLKSSRNLDFPNTKTGRRNIFTSSAILFSDLICCTSDVQLLKNKGVIVDHSANNNRDIIDFFHSIVDRVDRGNPIVDPIYANMFHELNTYSPPATNYATKYIILLSHFFSRFLDRGYNLRNFFKRGYNFVATLLAILTVVQTCYAVVSYHDPKKS